MDVAGWIVVPLMLLKFWPTLLVPAVSETPRVASSALARRRPGTPT